MEWDFAFRSGQAIENKYYQGDWCYRKINKMTKQEKQMHAYFQKQKARITIVKWEMETLLLTLTIL